MPHLAAPSILAPLIAALEKAPDPRRAAFDLLPALLTSTDWLPPNLLTPDPSAYRRELLHQAPDGRYSIGCFVWSARQATKIHDHTSWGAVGLLTGRLRERSFILSPAGGLLPAETRVLEPGGRLECGPEEDGIHEVAGLDPLSVSIHIYGAPFDHICRTLYEGGAA